MIHDGMLKKPSRVGKESELNTTQHSTRDTLRDNFV